MPRAKGKFVVVSTTVATPAQAATLATAIVTHRLAACVQSLPIRSTFRWKGKVERAAEQLLLAKTRAARVQALLQFIRARHPYELPEILIAPVTGGLPEYLQWLAAETSIKKRVRTPRRGGA